MHLLVAKIAVALGEGWSKRADDDPRHCWAHIDRAEGGALAIYLKFSYYKSTKSMLVF